MTTIQDIRDAFAVPPLTPEEKRALEVAQCARHAVLDTATMCARAGLVGQEIMEALTTAHEAMLRLIETIEGKN